MEGRATELPGKEGYNIEGKRRKKRKKKSKAHGRGVEDG